MPVGKPFKPGPDPRRSPGGVTKAAADLRVRAIRALEYGFRRAEQMLESHDPEVVALALNFLANRALGRPSAPAELPDATPMPKPESAPSAHGLLSEMYIVTQAALARLRLQVDEGLPIAEASLAAIADHAKTIATIAKEERELAKDGAAAKLSDTELRAKVLEATPLEQLQAELARRGGQT